jgi:L-aminopeptidase/D-esterase-like protein
VNAIGDIRDPRSGSLIAGARVSPESMELADSERQILRGRRGGFTRENTTLAVIATNARLSKVEVTKVAQLAHLGMARTIYPVNTMSDGDLVIAMSLGNEGADVDTLGVAAAEALAQAIVRAVKLAPTMGGVPGLASLMKR